MFNLCADRKCDKKNSCFRFVTDPLATIQTNAVVRIEATLKHPDERSCSKFYPVVYTRKEAA